MLLQMALFHSFLRPILHSLYTTSSLFIHLLTDTNVAFMSWPLQIMLLWTLGCVHLFELQFFSFADIWPGAGLLDHMVIFFNFIYFCLRWVFIAVSRLFSSWGEPGLLSSCGAQPSCCAGFSRCRVWALRWASAVVVHRLSCPMAWWIFLGNWKVQKDLNQRSNPCPLHWQEDFYPLHHQGIPQVLLNPLFLCRQLPGLSSISVSICTSPGWPITQFFCTLWHHFLLFLPFMIHLFYLSV